MKQDLRIVCEDGTVEGTKIYDAEGKPLAFVKKVVITIDAEKPRPTVVLELSPVNLGLDIKAAAEIKSLMEGAKNGEYLQGPHSSLAAGQLASGCFECPQEDECRPLNIAERVVCEDCGTQFFIEGESGEVIEIPLTLECVVTPREGSVAYCAECQPKESEEE